MRLLSDRVKIEIIPEEDVYEGNLYIAPNPVTGMRNNYFRGKVVDIGNGRNIHGKVLPMTVKVGDVVMYPLSQYKLYDEKYHIVFETDIYGVEI